MDYAEPPTPIDGVYQAVFSVRDLASGRQLAWLPVPAATAAHAAPAIESLFREHGPPLVMKCDNGAPFIAERTADLPAEWKITTLFFPAYTPRYNGACEAGIGGLKVRTHYLAAARDRPGRWTSEDVEAARRLADEEHYPRRLHGCTAHEVSKERSPSTGVDERFATTEESCYTKPWTEPASGRPPCSRRARLSFSPEERYYSADLT